MLLPKMSQKFPPASLYSKNTWIQFQSLGLIFFFQILLCTPSLKNVFCVCGKDGELME